ncbi:MAG TPA: CocE/NonD family hydrolase C-terminal non-catalytic domain-containing protein, partial [Actinoplanes sp.]
ETGDYNRFWAERNYVPDADRVRASVFLVHGLHDDNVRTQNGVQWWNALARNGVPRKIWLHQAGHADPFNVRRAAWLATLHRWFDLWLYKIDTGIMREPMADVETAPNQWQTARNWPIPTSRPVTLRLGDGTLGAGSGARARAGNGAGAGAGAGGGSEAVARQTFVDNPARTAEELVANETGTDPNRLAYLSAPVERETRLSGSARVTVRADLAGDSPYLTALLVDYGTATRYAGTRTLPVQDCVAPGIDGDPGCFYRREHITAETPYEIVSRGWLDVRNRLSPARTTPIVPGRSYTFTWNLQPEDHVFAAGHRIGLVLISTERDHTLRYPAGTVVGVRPGGSKLVLSLG